MLITYSDIEVGRPSAVIQCEVFLYRLTICRSKILPICRGVLFSAIW